MIFGDYSRKRATLFSIDGQVIETVKEITEAFFSQEAVDSFIM